MSKTAKQVLQDLHTQIGEQLLLKIQDGSADAKDFANAIKFLKDNGIDCLPSASRPLSELQNTLGDFAGEPETLQ